MKVYENDSLGKMKSKQDFAKASKEKMVKRR